jgi:putative Ca2+/H+ antiporter (TMEM165/GDT1 family)
LDFSIIISAFSLIFLAEVGDKSQLLAMSLAHRYRPLPVIAGTFLAFTLLNILAVWAGQAIFQWISPEIVLLAAGALFLFFGYRAWKEADEADTEEKPGRATKGAFTTSFTMIFLAEFGDKTQLAMIALVAGTGELWPVFIGGTLGLWAVSLVGILFGSAVLRRLPKHWVHRAAAVMFVAFGVLALGEVALNVNGLGVH